jgi:hypothetical protein
MFDTVFDPDNDDGFKEYTNYDTLENEHPGVALRLLGINDRDVFERTDISIYSLQVVMKK